MLYLCLSVLMMLLLLLMQDLPVGLFFLLYFAVALAFNRQFV